LNEEKHSHYFKVALSYKDYKPGRCSGCKTSAWSRWFRGNRAWNTYEARDNWLWWNTLSFPSCWSYRLCRDAQIKLRRNVIRLAELTTFVILNVLVS